MIPPSLRATRAPEPEGPGTGACGRPPRQRSRSAARRPSGRGRSPPTSARSADPARPWAPWSRAPASRRAPAPLARAPLLVRRLVQPAAQRRVVRTPCSARSTARHRSPATPAARPSPGAPPDERTLRAWRRASPPSRPAGPSDPRRPAWRPPGAARAARPPPRAARPQGPPCRRTRPSTRETTPTTARAAAGLDDRHAHLVIPQNADHPLLGEPRSPHVRSPLRGRVLASGEEEPRGSR